MKIFYFFSHKRDINPILEFFKDFNFIFDNDDVFELKIYVTANSFDIILVHNYNFNL